MIKYVLGFALSEDKSKILLIKKNRPEWQNGLLNGIGGKVENFDSSTRDAMVREFEEETGILTQKNNWSYLFDMKGYDNNSVFSTWEVSVFYTFSNKIFDASTKTDEQVEVYDVDLNFIKDNSVSNLAWIIGMILDKDIKRITFNIKYINN